MHDPNENDEDVSQGMITDLERSESESGTRSTREEEFDRRTVLQALVAGGGVGAFGSDLFVDEVAGESSGTSTSGWEKKPPQLETPWTDEVGPDNAHPEYPRPQMVREDWKNLNGVWQFSGTSKGESPPIGQELDERILVPYPIESGLSGIKRHEVWMWYRRTFTVPNSWVIPTAHPGDGVGNNPNAQRLLLHFEAVDWDATVYVNGQEVATHQGGYDHFVADVTGALTDTDQQELVVGVYDPTGNNTKPIGTQPVGRQGVGTGYKGEQTLLMTPTSGIWQTVWLEPVPEARINGLDMTPDLDNEVLNLTVNATNTAETTVKATAYDGNKKIGSITGPPNEELDLSVPEPHLWSPEDPFLYNLEVTLHRNRGNGKTNEKGAGKPVDSVTSYFGMRSLGKREINGIARPTLNGKAIYQLGSLESGWWPDGIQTPPTDDAQVYNLAAQKELGFNMVRKHMKIESRRWFYHTDRLGLLVYQDMPNMPRRQDNLNRKAHDQFEKELHAMVTEHDNHPSATVWIPFNEAWGIAEPNVEYISEVAGLVSEWDPERLVDPHSGYNVGAVLSAEAGDVKDVHVYPGPGAPEPEPDRFSLCGEYSSPSLVIPEHTWGECPSRATPEEFISRYVDKTEELRLLMVQNGLSGSVYTATTDLENHCNGLITYDRKVLKPQAANSLEQFRKANETVIEQSKVLMENASIDVQVPDTYLADESFEITATFTNPKSMESNGNDVHDLVFSLSALPDGWTSTADTPTQFDTVADGKSMTARWEVTTDSMADGDIEFQFETTFVIEDEKYQFTDSKGMSAAQIAFYRFENDNTDSSSYDHTFTLENGASYDDQVAIEGDYSLHLDGTDDYALVSEFRQGFLHEAFSGRTVSMWIKPDSTTGLQGLYSEGGTFTGFAVRINDGTLEVGVMDGGAFASIRTAFDWTDWTHVAAVFDNGTLRLYVNGTEVAANPDIGYDTVSKHIAGCAIGGSVTTNPFRDGTDNFFGGHIDATAIYNRALSDEEIAQLYNNAQ